MSPRDNNRRGVFPELARNSADNPLHKEIENIMSIARKPTNKRILTIKLDNRSTAVYLLIGLNPMIHTNQKQEELISKLIKSFLITIGILTAISTPNPTTNSNIYNKTDLLLSSIC